MHWIHLTAEDQLQKIIVKSQERLQVIFKYSSCCHFSEVVFERLQQNCCPGEIDFNFLDLTNYKYISEKISYQQITNFRQKEQVQVLSPISPDSVRHWFSLLVSYRIKTGSAHKVGSVNDR